MAKKKDRKIVKMPAGDFVTEGMKLYGKEVVEQRALPDFRDGFKPVQRRILWAMHLMGMTPTKHYNKAARVVGEVIGKYHPHGDQAVFGSLVTMVNARYGLVEGEGNWGTAIDPPAAMRYIECRLSKLGMRVFDCIDIADLTSNYDATLQEPVILPCRLPILLLNGTDAIAVGVASRVPSHNLKEIVAALKYIITSKKHKIREVMKLVKGPDFVHGGILTSSRREVRELYKNGEGSLDYSCNYAFEKGDKGSNVLVVNSYAPGFNPISFLTYCKENLVDTGLVEYARNESGGGEDRLCVGFKNSLVITEQVLPQLRTRVHYKFNVTERSEKDVKFRTVDFIELLEDWVNYLRDIETDYIKYQIGVLQEKLSKAEAILIAIQKLSIFFKILETGKDLVKDVVKKLKLTKDQAEYILDVSSRRLAKLNLKEQKSIVDGLVKDIKTLQGKLKKLDEVMLETLDSFSDFFDKRRTLIREQLPTLKIDNIYVVGNEKGLLDIDLNLGDGRWKWDFATNAKNGFISVTKTGLGAIWSHDEIEKGVIQYPDLVGLVPGNVECLIVGDDHGNGICIDKPRITEFMTMKTDGEVSGAVGLRQGDTLLVYDDRVDLVKKYPFDKIPTTRRNSKGWKMLPRRRRTLVFDVFRKSYVVVSLRGKQVGLDDFVNNPAEHWIIATKNLVIAGTKQFLLKQDEAIDFIKNKGGGSITDIIKLD